MQEDHAGGVIAGAKWELPADFSVKISWLSDFAAEGSVLHTTGMQATQSVQHSTDLDQLRLTLTWVTSILVCNNLLASDLSRQ